MRTVDAIRWPSSTGEFNGTHTGEKSNSGDIRRGQSKSNVLMLKPAVVFWHLVGGTRWALADGVCGSPRRKLAATAEHRADIDPPRRI
jgi:hypothetical protein